jgi:cell division protein FtsN/Mrp family chromosome partitioning ATPase
MTGPAQPVSNVLQKARQRLLRLGLTDEHILTLPFPASTSFDPAQLNPVNADPYFAPVAQRVLRFLRGGRGLSIAVADDAPGGGARVQTAVELASSLTRQGIQVVIADMDFRSPGLHGLVVDPHTEGIIDMVRFGRSCRSVLQKPIDAGPALLAAGSFPVQDGAPLDEDAVRSVLHRVSLHCELALYVAPLLPDETSLNPVVRLCEHVLLVHSVSEDSVDIIERIQLMQQARLHVAGVVLFDETAAHAAPGAPIWQPGPFETEPQPPAVVSPPAVPPPAETPPAAPTPEPPFPAISVPPAVAGPSAPAGAEPESPVPPPTGPPTAAPSPADTPQAPATEPSPPVMPHIPWTGRGAEATPGTPVTAPQAPADEAIPEIHLPDEPPLGPPEVRTRTVPAPPPEAPTRDERTVREPAPEDVSTVDSTPAVASSQEGFDEPLWAASETGEAFELDRSAPLDVRRGGVESAELEDAETEFAYDDGSNWSRTPLYILITLLVVIGGFFGWALWTKRGIEQQVGEQLSDTEWIGESQPAQPGTQPDDAAALPSGDEHLPSSGLQGLEESGDSASPPPSQPRTQEPQTSTPAVSPQTPVPTGSQPQGTPDVGTGDAGRSQESGATGTPPATPPQTRPTTPAPRTTPPAGDVEYTVHVGSFRHLEQAYQDIATLQKHGFVGRAVKTDLGNKGIWYRVYVGGFSTRAEAEEVRDSILELPEYRYAQVKRIPR